MGFVVSRLTKPLLGIAAVLTTWWGLDYLIAHPIPNLDVSAQARYANVLGKRFRTQIDLVAIGYTMDRNYKKRVDYVALVDPPGFSGPEVVAKGLLPKGAVVEVTAVLRADSWLVERVQYVVERIDAEPPLEGPMVLDVDMKAARNFGLPERKLIAVGAPNTTLQPTSGRDAAFRG